MIKINYKQPEPTESPDDICIYNLKISDKYRNLKTFSESSVAWLKNDPTRNYQDLEILIRNLDLDTHLIAKPFNKLEFPELVLSIPNRQTQPDNLTYMLLVSCRPKSEAIKELENYHECYDINFNYLKQTGSFSNPNITNENENVNNKANSDYENEKKILNSELKYDFIVVTGKESIQVIYEDLVKRYEKEPETKICGKLDDKDIFSLTINGEIVSPIGWIEVDNDYKLIDFRMFRKN
jgi:hypothetical protein